MTKRYSVDELNHLDGRELTGIILSLQDQVKSLSESYERLIEQIRIADQARFGRRSEKHDVIDGSREPRLIVAHLSYFHEAFAPEDMSGIYRY
jgi:hypothetical protein